MINHDFLAQSDLKIIFKELIDLPKIFYILKPWTSRETLRRSGDEIVCCFWQKIKMVDLTFSKLENIIETFIRFKNLIYSCRNIHALFPAAREVRNFVTEHKWKNLFRKNRVFLGWLKRRVEIIAIAWKVCKITLKVTIVSKLSQPQTLLIAPEPFLVINPTSRANLSFNPI